MPKAGPEMNNTPAADSQAPWLRTDEVHVWMAAPHRCCQPELISQYVSWLDEQERSRYDRFHFSQHRHEYLIAHALLRSSLSRYSGCAPAAWRFTRNTYGRPEIAAECGQPPLRFNLSHTTGLVACAIARSADVGIDVELMTRAGDLAAIADLSCTPDELAALQPLSGTAWSQRFFSLWTLKEAYVKARGQGLSIPLLQIRFQFQPHLMNASGVIQFESLLDSASAPAWKFASLNPTPRHCMAVATHLETSLQIQFGWSIPGRGGQATHFSCISSQDVVQRQD